MKRAFITLAILLTLAGAVAAYEGFGSGTPGGAGQPIVQVTTLADSGPGSLREALSAGNRTITFTVAGDINLVGHLYVLGAFITVDGFTAPSPGITLKGKGPILHGTKGAHDVVIRGIRVRDATIDGFQLAGGTYNVVLDHVSVADSTDGNIDITDGAHDVTVSWSIVGANAKNMLLKYGSSAMTLHHNLLASNQRNPQARIDDTTTGEATSTTLDLRNNVIASWVQHGTLCWYGPWCNIVDNAYQKAANAIVVQSARTYVAGNVLFTGDVVTGPSTEPAPFTAPAVSTTDPETARQAIYAGAGVRPLDATDQAIVENAGGPPAISCPPPAASPGTACWKLTVFTYKPGTVTSTPAGITCPPKATCKDNYPKGSQVTLVATPAAGHTFVKWTGVCTGKPASGCVVTLTKSLSVAAYFSP